MEPRWLVWAKELQGIAQTGLAYARDVYDVERYHAVRRVAAEMMAAGGGVPFERVAALFAGQEGYATPKVDVRGAVFRGDEVLLVREVSDGGWTLPGGWADVNQTPAECVVREVREESGFAVRCLRLLAAWDRARQGHEPPHPFHTYKLFFLCEITGGAAGGDHETDGVAFFPVAALPPLSHARTLPEQVARLHALARDPHAPAAFD